MALDGILLNCILAELEDKIIGGRIDRAVSYTHLLNYYIANSSTAIFSIN